MSLILKVGNSYTTEHGKVAEITDAKEEIMEGKKTTIYYGTVGARVKESSWFEDGSICDGIEGQKLIALAAPKKDAVEKSKPYEKINTDGLNLHIDYNTVLSGSLKVSKVTNGFIINIDGNTLIASDVTGIVESVSNYITDKLTEPEGQSNENVVNVHTGN